MKLTVGLIFFTTDKNTRAYKNTRAMSMWNCQKKIKKTKTVLITLF